MKRTSILIDRRIYWDPYIVYESEWGSGVKLGEHPMVFQVTDYSTVSGGVLTFMVQYVHTRFLSYHLWTLLVSSSFGDVRTYQYLHTPTGVFFVGGDDPPFDNEDEHRVTLEKIFASPAYPDILRISAMVGPILECLPLWCHHDYGVPKNAGHVDSYPDSG